jgi:NADH-quinone oxidoreductase subunit D
MQHQYLPDAIAEGLAESEPGFFNPSALPAGQMILNLGPQHPSTHGVLRLEVLTDGELVLACVPHIGYLHRCFEAHAQNLPFPQIIPFVDRLDYLSAMNSEHIFATAVERMLGIEGTLEPRIEYIRVLVAELNRLASHFLAIGTFGLDVGSFTPFLYLMADREHIQRMLEWICGARMLYNYIWIGGLYYDLPIGFEGRAEEFCAYLLPRLEECRTLLLENDIFIKRTAGIGTLTAGRAIAWGATGPMLRGSGVAHDARKRPGYSVYSTLEFDIPTGSGHYNNGLAGDCWDRTWVRLQECFESVKIIQQCAALLGPEGEHRRTPAFNPQGQVPKKVRPTAQDIYVSGETGRGELGFHIRTDGKSDVPVRCHVRSPCFTHLAILPELAQGTLLADLVAITGSLDMVMGEVDK